MADSTRIRLPEELKRRLNRLEEATGEGTRAGAIDVAARYYTRMAGGPDQPTGVLEDLMSAAFAQGSLTPEEIAKIVDTTELPVEYSHEWTVQNPE